MNNILGYEDFLNEWKGILKTSKGKVKIINDDGSKVKVDGTFISRAIRRTTDKAIDKSCGGLSKLEDKFDSIISKVDSVDKSLASEISDVQYEHGIIKCPSDTEENELFALAPDNVGKGESLLSRLYSDVRMNNRSNGEKGDCCITDKKDNILYHIEVKSGGSTFKYRDIPSDFLNGVEDDDKARCAYSLASYLCSNMAGYFKDGKPLVMVCFNNEFNDRRGTTTADGFFWMNCGVIKSTGKSEQVLNLAKKLLPLITISKSSDGKAINKEGGRGFAISIAKGDESMIICHIKTKE